MNDAEQLALIYESLLLDAAKPVEQLRPNTRREAQITLQQERGKVFTLRAVKTRSDYVVASFIIAQNEWSKPYWNIHSRVTNIFQGQGYAPLMYDIALEFITNYLHSIAVPSFTTGGNTSEPASQIYKYYFEKRNDVQKHNDIAVDSEVEQRHNPYPRNQFPWMYVGYTKPLDIIPKLIAQQSLIIDQHLQP